VKIASQFRTSSGQQIKTGRSVRSDAKELLEKAAN
jgi:hypothetical protein